jgi:DNA repair exonuclease SbcCD nuclease subunit
MKKTIIITDTHFGVRQNSLIWLQSQKDYIYNELIPYIKQCKEEIQIIHCGDVFDSRSAINPIIATEVRKIFISLSDLCPVYILAGNHDFYSPTSDKISSLDLILNNIENLTIVRDYIYHLCDSILVPWYEFTIEKLKKAIDFYNPKYVFCHADLANMEKEYIPLFYGIQVYSGHIHEEWKKDNLTNLGSTYALTFADANQQKGVYILEDDELSLVAAKNIIRFNRFSENSIFDIDIEKNKDNYVQISIDKMKLLNSEYEKRISELSNGIKNFEVILTENMQDNKEITNFSVFDIKKECENNVPCELKEKFYEIFKKLENK